MPCVEVWQTSDLRPLRLGEEKKDRRKEGKKLQGKNIMAPLLHRAAIINTKTPPTTSCLETERAYSGFCAS